LLETDSSTVISQRYISASEMTYIVSSGALNSTHSLTQRNRCAWDEFCNCLPTFCQKRLFGIGPVLNQLCLHLLNFVTAISVTLAWFI